MRPEHALAIALCLPTGMLVGQATRIAPPAPTVLVATGTTTRSGALPGGSGLPLTGMAIGAGILGIPILICALDGERDGDYLDCNLRTIVAAALVGALFGGLIEGLLSPALPRDTTALGTAFRRDLAARMRRGPAVPWIGLVLGGAIGWGLVHAFCDSENPADDCGDAKLQVALIGALIGGTVDLFVRD